MAHSGARHDRLLILSSSGADCPLYTVYHPPSLVGLGAGGIWQPRLRHEPLPRQAWSRYHSMTREPASDGTPPVGASFDARGNDTLPRPLRQQGLHPALRLPRVALPLPGRAWGRESLDNVQAAGQTITLPATPGATTLGFLGAASDRPLTGAATITYTDGSTKAKPWTLMTGRCWAAHYRQDRTRRTLSLPPCPIEILQPVPHKPYPSDVFMKLDALGSTKNGGECNAAAAQGTYRGSIFSPWLLGQQQRNRHGNRHRDHYGNGDGNWHCHACRHGNRYRHHGHGDRYSSDGNRYRHHGTRGHGDQYHDALSHGATGVTWPTLPARTVALTEVRDSPACIWRRMALAAILLFCLSETTCFHINSADTAYGMDLLMHDSAQAYRTLRRRPGILLLPGRVTVWR